MVNVTKHAEKRIKERCGIRKNSAERFATLAFERGIERKQTKGALRKWLDGKYTSHKYQGGGGEVWLHGEFVFITCQQRVITVLNLPNEYKRYLKDYKTPAGEKIVN